MSVSHSAGLRRGRGESASDVIARAGLPAELAAVVTRVVSACRLWQHERADVARELCAHFADGLGAGHSPQELASSFGDPASAAKLITRAKKRGRGPMWKFTRFLFIALLALLAIYGVLAARYFMGEPTITVDYVAKVNAPSLAVPEDQRAWPRYREIILRLPVSPAVMRDALSTAEVGTESWNEAAAYVRAQAALLSEVRTAASSPRSGVILSTKPDFDARARPGAKPEPAGQPLKRPDVLEGSIYGIGMPSLGVFRELARILGFDARLAASEGDSVRALGNIRALQGLARHSAEPAGVLIGQLVNIAIHTLSVSVVDRILLEHPDLFSDGQLQELAALLNSWRVDPLTGRDTLNLYMERASMLDLLQRTYTDDGQGDGRLANLRLVAAVGSASGVDDSLLVRLGEPIAAQVLASRADMLREYDRVLAIAAAQETLPLSQRSDPAADAPVGLRGARYFVTHLVVPALDKASAGAALGAARRDAAVTGLALERYKRTKGSYPATLDALVPTYLAALPRDPWTGGTMQYRAPDAGAVGAEARPRLYIVGRNGTDDQGRGGASPSAPPSAEPDDQILWGPAIDAAK
jgi:hypothetical protein